MTQCIFSPPKKLTSISEWGRYESELYEIFKRDILENKWLSFRGKPVNIRWRDQFIYDKEKEFWHLIYQDQGKKTADYEDRYPDYERACRLHWIKEFIDNENICLHRELDDCESCYGYVDLKEGIRSRFFFPDLRYLIVLEEKASFWILITAYYVGREHEYKKLMRKAGFVK